MTTSTPLPAVPGSRLVAAGQRTGPYRLTDGTVLAGYFDPYLITSNPILLDQASRALAELLPPGTELIAAPVLAAVPLAAAVSLRTGLPTAFLRAEPKGHGTDRRIEGADVSGRRAVVIDDTARTGASLLNAARLLRAHRAHVGTALCILDRELGARARLNDHKITLRALVTQPHPGAR